MKRLLYLISLIAMIFTLAACGTAEQQAYDFNGNWYSAKDGYLYVFTDGDVFCEENYVTLDSGKKTSGGYYEYENFIEAYVIGTIGAGADVAPLYLIQEQGLDTLCSDAEGKNIIFCRDAAIAQQIVQQNEEDKKQQAEQKTKEERDSIYVAPTVTYDSAISGNYTYQFVGIEGIITSYKYSDFINWYDFDFWCWSDLENSYICKKISLDADEYSKEDIEHLQKFDDGDKVKFVFAVRSDFRSGDWLDIPQYLFAELVEKGEISEFELHNDTEDAKEPSTGISTADTTDIAVRFETDYIDGDRLHITVFTKNTSDEIFAGNVYVTFYSADGKDRLGSDTIIVDELLPGRESWADIIVDAYRGTPKMTVDFSEVSFTPIKEVVSEIDLDATEKTKSSYYWNFDGVSWYNDITDIAVYENGTCVVVLKDTPKEGGQFYASTIWSCGNDHGVDTVQVIDKDGTILSVYGDGDMISVTPNSSGKITSSVDTSSSENFSSKETETSNGTVSTSNNVAKDGQNITSIAAGLNYSVAVRNDGSVVAVGYSDYGECDIESWDNIISITSGGTHTVGLKNDGTVVAVGYNDFGQCKVSDWEDIVEVSASTFSTLGLKADGTVVIAGYNSDVHGDIANWKDIISISDGGNFCVGLQKDGGVAVSGLNWLGQYEASNWTNMVAVKTSSNHTVGLKADGTVVAIGNNDHGQCNTSEWANIVAIAVGESHTMGIKADGTVVAVGYNEYGQCNVSTWTDVISIDADLWHTVGLKADGTVIATGDNACGQCNVAEW